MATTGQIGFDAGRIDVGATYATESLGYPRAEIEALPACCTSRFAGVGNQPPENYCGIAQTSRNVLADLAPRVQWLATVVASDKVYCVFLAEGPAVTREHAARIGAGRQ